MIGVATPEVGPFRFLYETCDSGSLAYIEAVAAAANHGSGKTPRVLASNTGNHRMIKIKNCSFLNNYSMKNGGALLLHSHKSLEVKIYDSTFYSNKAAEKGGAIYLA